MISELQRAIEQAGKLSEEDQRAIAKMIMDEINWDKTIANSLNVLDSLAAEALDEYQKGKTKPLDL